MSPQPLVIEPLARFDQDGTLVPYLTDEVPTVGKRRRVRGPDIHHMEMLKDGLQWSDGTPVTSADLVFTAQYCMDPEGGCAQLAKFEGVEQR